MTSEDFNMVAPISPLPHKYFSQSQRCVISSMIDVVSDIKRKSSNGTHLQVVINK
jgi:hypothetical protein